MSVTVQSMLDELREEMSSFEGSLPEISDRDALDGLLGIKHVLRERWDARDKSSQPESTNGRAAVSVLFGAALIGEVIALIGLANGRGDLIVTGGAINALIAAIAAVWWVKSRYFSDNATDAARQKYEEQNRLLDRN